MNKNTHGNVQQVLSPNATITDYPKNINEWRIALTDPNSQLHKEMVNRTMTKLAEVVEEMFAVFANSMKEQDQSGDLKAFRTKKRESEEVPSYPYKTMQHKHMSLFS